MPDRCWAKFEFVAENDDELYFAVGEQIDILERDDAYGDGWWRGRTADGKEGLFPMSYITETEPVKASAPAAPAAASIATPPSPTSPAVPLHRIPSSTDDGTMGKTITDINKAIDSVRSPDDSDDDDYSMGIGHSTRAKLAEQAKLENDQRERERAGHHAHRRTSSGFHAHKGISGNPAGLVYSDESDDEDEVDREREPSLVPSSGFAALAAAAAGSAGAAATHMTGGLFTAPKEDVVSPRAQVIDMPPVTEEAAPPATAPDRRGSFGQQLDSPAVDRERPLSTVGLAITTDGDLPPPPSAPESVIERSEPPERPLEVAAAPEPAQDSGSENASGPSEPLQQPVAQVDETPAAQVDETPAVDTVSAQNSITEVTPKSESAPVSERVSTPEAESAPALSSPPSVLAATPIPEVPAQVQDNQSNGDPSISPAILAPAAVIGGLGTAAAVHSSPTSDTHARDAPATPAFISLASPPPISTALIPSAPSPATPAPTGSPTSWSVAQVVDWARSRGFDDAVCSKFQEHEISGDLLLELDANLLKELEIPQFGKRLRIAQAIGELRGERRTRPESFDRSASGSASPAALGDDEFGWHGSRKGSVIDSPIAPPIQEEGGEMVLPAPSVVSAHSRASSMPASPVTPVTKRSSSGSTYGHKKNKASVDKPASERMSFFSVNRQRKPPPREEDVNLEKNRSLSRLGFSSNAKSSKGPASTPASSPVVPSGPSPQRLSVTPAESVVDKIGKPDFAGYMKKKGERYNTWKLRYFVLRGPNLYYMRSEHEHRIKGHIDLTGHRVVVDENVHPGNYGFRVVGGAGEKEHAFSSSEQSTVREWMKALIKATIARDYSAPVVSSCNIPTIPLNEAQAMSPAPRPPSPTQRDATQRASRRENVNQLTPRDASVLMSLDGGLDSGHKRRVSGLGVPAAPPRPSRELRRPSGRSIASVYEPEAPQEQELLQWVNANVPPSIRATAFPGSFTNGLVITRLAEQLSGAKETTPDAVFAPMSNGAPSVDGLFAMMDTLIDHGFDTAGVSPGDVLGGDGEAIGRLLASLRAYAGAR